MKCGLRNNLPTTSVHQIFGTRNYTPCSTSYKLSELDGCAMVTIVFHRPGSCRLPAIYTCSLTVSVVGYLDGTRERAVGRAEIQLIKLTVRSHHTQKTPDSKGCEKLVHRLQSFKLNLENGMRNSVNSSARDSSLGRGGVQAPSRCSGPAPATFALHCTSGYLHRVRCVHRGARCPPPSTETSWRPKVRVVPHVPREDSRNW